MSLVDNKQSHQGEISKLVPPEDKCSRSSAVLPAIQDRECPKHVRILTEHTITYTQKNPTTRHKATGSQPS